MNAHEYVVEVERLRKVFPTRSGRGRPEVVAVDEVSFAVPRGTSLAIVGESGSGKTTTARMLLGLERPTTGTVRIDGREWSGGRLSSAQRRSRAAAIQIVFQDPYSSLDPQQTIGGCLEEALRLQSSRTAAQRTERIAELLDQVGLDTRIRDSRPRQMSGGQRQRVAIARALAAEPKVIVLDEAVASLDVSVQAQILNLLADVRDRTGISYILISHDLAVVRQITDTAIVMRHGAVVEQGRTTDILDHPKHPYTSLLRASIPGPGWRPERALSAS
jgi:ABC-type glutathione transport system ATPase component